MSFPSRAARGGGEDRGEMIPGTVDQEGVGQTREELWPPLLRLLVPRVPALADLGRSLTAAAAGRAVIDPGLDHHGLALGDAISLVLAGQGCPAPIAQRNWPPPGYSGASGLGDSGAVPENHPGSPGSSRIIDPVQCQALMAHDGTNLYLQYQVMEPEIRCIHDKDQAPVYQDSCVELFISPGGDYRNFEFNAIGSCLHYIGPDRHNRRPLPPEVMGRILRIPSRGTRAQHLRPGDGPYRWSLLVMIPGDVLGLDPGSGTALGSPETASADSVSPAGEPAADLSGTSWRGNLYKCGDGLEQPHYLSWSAIDTPKPDFHVPEFFGIIDFQ